MKNIASRIAFVSTMGGVPWGGSEELWSGAALRLRASGHDVSVSVFRWPSAPPRVKSLATAGARVDFRPLRLEFAGRMIEKLRQKMVPAPLDRRSMGWLESEKPKLVVISQGGPWDGIPWMNACKMLGIPYCCIVQAHSEIWWPTDEDLLSTLPALLGARRVFFVSRANRELMEMQCGTILAHAQVVSNPWKVDVNQPTQWPVEGGKISIACVGRIDPRAKGQDVLLRVMALPKWKERQITLNFYGDGPCEKSMEALAKLLRIDNVAFRGQVSDVDAIWSENHALVLPSRYEGLPLVIVEAMFRGRMVITTDIAGNAEYLSEGVTGFIADAPTVKLLDEAMERAWSNRSRWQDMGVAARNEIADKVPSDPIAVFSECLLDLMMEGSESNIHVTQE